MLDAMGQSMDIDDWKLDVCWSDDYLMIHDSRFQANKRQKNYLKFHYYCVVFG